MLNPVNWWDLTRSDPDYPLGVGFTIFSDIQIGVWDWVMLVGVSSLATILAYVKSPATKAAIAMFPIPFTLASLALGKPVTVSNVVAVPILVLYYVIARWLHVRARWPIVASIITAIMTYAVIATLLIGLLPPYEWFFWVALVVVWCSGLLAHLKLPRTVETEHKSTLAVPLKFLAVSGVVTLVMVIKQVIQGFASVFPMLGTVAVYEARHSLSTLTRYSAVLMFTMPPMLAACHVSYTFCGLPQNRVGLGCSLAVGWVAHAAAMWVVARTTPRLSQTA